MLKINKILSKKIKFPLSLRGAKQRSNLSGFSLIELMVAVAILVMAIFGIFHAYSAGFMGMADARDRTVATNYAREAMEDIKNKDFDEILLQARLPIYRNGIKTKFEREVIVDPSVTNLKKVTTKVYWEDRNNNPKMVETDMVVHFIETTAGIPIRIMLVANPYNVLTKDDVTTADIHENQSIITAVVKDAKGNTVTSESINISFSITTGSSLGIISPESENSLEGKATTIFTASDDAEGEVVITATATGLTSDSVIINVTDPEEPVKINLTADTYFMTPNVSSTSQITAEIFDAGNGLVESATNEVTFTVTGPGTLFAPTTKPAVGGKATITLASDGTPGTITVTASSSGLVPDFVTVITGGKVSLSASPTTVPVGEKSEITVTTKDVNGVPIKYVGTINLYINESSTGSGTLPSYVTFDGSTSGSTSSMTVTFTATSEGTVNIDAEDEAGILTSADPISLNITQALVPHHIDVSAEPASIETGGTDTSTITARVNTADYITVTSYSELIVFSTDLGTFPNGSTTIDTSDDINVSYVNGGASVELNAASDIGTATITVTSGSVIPGTIEVGFYIEADNILLKADPQNILAGGDTCIITATIRDGDITITEYEGAVTFTIMEGYPSGVKFTSTNQSSITINALAGEAPITLQSKNWVGTAKIKAIASDGIPYLEQDINIPVGINLELIEDSVGYNIGIVSFDIDVQGAELLLEEMQVSWNVGDPVEALDKIDIAGITIYDSNPSNPVGSIVYTDTLNERVADIDVNDTTLSTGTSAIEMDFSTDMSGKTFEVIFNPNSGDYLVDLVPL